MNTHTQSPENRQAARTRLLRLRRSLLAGMRDELHTVLTAADAEEEAGDDLERSSEALREEELALRLARVQQGTAGLAAVNAALTALNNGTYGICRDCGEPIGAGRLESNPVADRCRDCATVHEKSAA